MTIIGITGTAGAGKGTIVDYLLTQKDFKHYSARDFIVKEINRRGLEVDRDSMILVGNDLRASNSPSFVIESLYKEAAAVGGDAVIESIRAVGEVEAMRGKPDFYLLAVDADISERYRRIKARGLVTDMVTLEEFKGQEEKEMTSDDPNKQNLSACIALADYKIVNNGTIDDLYVQVEEVLAEIMTK